MDFWQVIQDNWTVIEQAPLAAVVLIAVGAAAGYLAARHVYGERLAFRGERIAHLETQLLRDAPSSRGSEERNWMKPEDPDAIAQQQVIVGRALGVTLRRHEKKVGIDRIEANEHFNADDYFYWRGAAMVIEEYLLADLPELAKRTYTQVTCRYIG